MKMPPFAKTWWVLFLAMIVCGCERDIASSFEVTNVQVLTRDEVRTVMGRDWTRRMAEVPMPSTVVFVGLASNADLAEFIRERSSGLSVAAFVCDPKRRLGVVAPFVYSGGKDVTARKISNESSAMENGVYRYQIVLWTDGPEDQISELLEKDVSICVQLKAANMATIYLSKEIVITKTMLGRGPIGNAQTSAVPSSKPQQ